MLFSSITFLYYFLPLVLILYFIAPKKLKNVVLLTASLAFYAWGEPKCVFLMLLTIVWNYCFGILIEKAQKKSTKKIYLTVSIIGTLSGLLYFKYAGFFVENFARIFGITTPALNIVLPIGISFYTFQILSYSVDVYRGEVAAQKNPITLATYIALFPQLIAGPIVRYKDVAEQLDNRTHSFDKAAEGIKRFVCGLSKKIILANTLGELCEGFYGSNDLSVAYFWLFAASYTLQIYFDFSGYSDMAIGLGKIFGFDFLENFRYPFISKSITEFWRRWHISLGSWFRDYVYFPMGGSRVGRGRHVFNLLTVWFLTGFWHGAEWNFILWGLFFFVFLTIEKFFFKGFLEKSKFISHIYTLLLVAVSFVIFSGNGLQEALIRVSGLFGAGNIPLVSEGVAFAVKNYGTVILVAAVCSTPLLKMLYDKLRATKASTIIEILEVPVLLILVIIATAYLADGSFNPFLYFRF
jgi:alginate O-acetyltransferase complex protein AlgI